MAMTLPMYQPLSLHRSNRLFTQIKAAISLAAPSAVAAQEGWVVSILLGNNHKVGAKGQMKLWRANDSAASERMDMAIADFVHSNCLPFSLAEDPKFL